MKFMMFIKFLLWCKTKIKEFKGLEKRKQRFILVRSPLDQYPVLTLHVRFLHYQFKFPWHLKTFTLHSTLRRFLLKSSCTSLKLSLLPQGIPPWYNDHEQQKNSLLFKIFLPHITKLSFLFVSHRKRNWITL